VGLVIGNALTHKLLKIIGVTEKLPDFKERVFGVNSVVLTHLEITKPIGTGLGGNAARQFMHT